VAAKKSLTTNFFRRSLLLLFLAGFRIRIRMNPHSFELLDPDPHTNCGSGSSRAKMTQKNLKKNNFHLLKCWMFSFDC
jgi:hypothetical protein